MTDTFSVLSEKLGALLSEEEQAIFEANFSLLKQDKNLFVFGCRDKAVCAVVGVRGHAVTNRHGVSAACTKLLCPGLSIRFRQTGAAVLPGV